MGMQTLSIFVVACIGYCNSLIGSVCVSRPLVLCALTGIALGDVATGCMVGATLELVWLGAMAVGASNPPDMTSGSIIGTAYVITTGSEISTALAVAVPVSMLMQMLWNFMMAVIGPMMAARADRAAAACDPRGMDRMHLLFDLIQVVPLAALCAGGFVAGSTAVQGVVDAIPAFVTDGLDYAMGIIPAIGFAMLARMIIDKKTACFLFLGFVLVAYGGMNLVGVALVGAIVAAVVVLNGVGGAAGAPALEGAAAADDDDNEF